MIDSILAQLVAIGGFLKDPGAHTVAVFSFFVSTPVTFLAMQTWKRLKFASTGKQWPPERIQVCSWAWFAVISFLFQELLYWGTPNQVPWNIFVVVTVVGILCYIATVEWWIEKVKAVMPKLWDRLRTDRRRGARRATDAGDITSDDVGTLP